MDIDTAICYAVVPIMVVIGLILTILQTRAPNAPPPAPDFSDDREPIIKAAEVLEQRRYGRWLGPRIVVNWTPGEVYEVDRYARFIMDNPGYDVEVRVRGDIKNCLSKGHLPYP